MKLHLGLALIIGAATSALGAQEYCNANFKPVSDKDVVLDLSPLNREFTISQKEENPPSTTENQVKINICDALPVPQDEKEAEDFCEKGTYICRRTIISKGDVQVIAYIQNIAGDYEKDKLNPAFKAVDGNQDLTQSGAKFSLVLNGGRYKDQTQFAQLTLECDTSQERNKEPEAPTLISYHNNVLSLNWKTVHACGTKEGEAPPPTPPKNDDEKSEGMSGAGVFFTIIGVVLAIYFVGGAFYNFKMYNARGLDLIPHRDFWLDLPYLIKDLISHLIDSIMSHRRGSGGYVSV